MRFLNIDGK